jgi:perosamine synthetase
VVLADSVPIARDEVSARLDAEGIETRPIFPPIHTQPVYETADGPELAVASRISARGLSLPSGALLTEADIERVVASLIAAVDA